MLNVAVQMLHVLLVVVARVLPSIHRMSPQGTDGLLACLSRVVLAPPPPCFAVFADK